MPWYLIPLLAGAAILVIAVAILAHRAEQRRIDALRSFAAQTGLHFHPESEFEAPITDSWLQRFFKTTPPDRFGIIQRFQPFEPFGKGDDPGVTNLLAGTYEGLHFYAFDYAYTEETGFGDKRRTTKHEFRVVAARLPLLLPALVLKPEDLGTRLGQKLGFRDITFELDEFNRAYYIQCADQRRAYDLIHPGMIEYLLSIDRRHWQVGGFYIVLHEWGKLTNGYCGAAMRDILGFVERIPPYVKEDLGFKPTWTHALD